MAITGTGTSQDFAYTGDIQTLVAPFSGLYQLEVWGAQGGYRSSETILGGKGGYAKGYIYLKKNTTIYVVVGGKGNKTYDGNAFDGGYNGGGAAKSPGGYYDMGCGGGATHMATKTGILSSLENDKDKVLIVAGGGGGAAHYWNGSHDYGYNGHGGGTNGTAPTQKEGSGRTSPTGGTQTEGGTGAFPGSFGQGGGSKTSKSSGGGGGWYGGGAHGGNGGGAGGSGYTGGVPKITYEGSTYSPTMSNGVQSGDGKATITLVKGDPFPTMYLGDIQVDGMYLGDIEIEGLCIGDVML